LTEGPYTLIVSYEGYDSYSNIVEVGYETSVNVSLSETIVYDYVELAYRVFDSGIPIEGARVELVGGLVGLTNATGYANMSGYLRVSSPYSVEITHDLYKTYYDAIDLFTETYREVNMTAQDTVIIRVLEDLGLYPIVDANVTLIDGALQEYSALTNTSGYVSITDLDIGVYQVEIVKSGYNTLYSSLNLSESFYYTFYMVEDIAPDGGEGVVNSYDNTAVGNYWDDLGGVVVFAEETGIYEIFGDNPDNPVDNYPLDKPYMSDTIIHTKYVRFQPKSVGQNRHLINTFVELKWKAMWNDTDVEIIDGAHIYLNTGQQLEFRDGYWCANVTSDKIGVANYYVSYVEIEGVEFFEPDIGLTITWDYLVIITTTTGTITTTTISTITEVVDFNGVILVTVGLSIGLILVIVLFMKWFMKSR